MSNLALIQPQRVDFDTQQTCDWLDGLPMIGTPGLGGAVAGAANVGTGLIAVGSVVAGTLVGAHTVSVTGITGGITSVTVDGAIGDVTLHAVGQDEDNDALIARYCAARLGTLRGLKTWRTYGKGWSARIANAQKIGQGWASVSVGPAPVAVDQVGGNRKAVVSAETITRPLLSTASTTVVTSASAVAAPVSELGQQLEVMRDWFAWMPYVLGGLAVVAGVAGIIVKYGHAVADKVQAGSATQAVDVSADEDLPAVTVDDSIAPEAPVAAPPATAAEAA